MSVLESIPLVPSQKIDRTPVRATNTGSLDSRHFTKRWADHARVEWPDGTDANWAHAADVNIRLAQYWLQDPPGRDINADGITAVLTKMLKRD